MIKKIIKKLFSYFYILIGYFKRMYSYNLPLKVIVMVDGGLGSQLNKYLIGRFIEKTRKVKVEYDLSWFSDCGISIDGKDTRNFDLLEVFPDLEFSIAERLEAIYFKKYFRFLNRKPFQFTSKLITRRLPLYVDGYYSHYKYIVEADAFQEFKFNEKLFELNRKHLESITSVENSIAIHIRRGDYVNSPHDVLTVDYFLNAVSFMQEQFQGSSVFFVFSNDMPWVKEQFLPKLEKNIVIKTIEGNDNSNGGSDMFLMSKCNNHICSNSSFSYYAAYLSKNEKKKVIIPEEWMKEYYRYEGVNEAYRIPGWMVMSNSGAFL